MRRVVVNNSLTLDGVMQAPGRPDEDRRGGFEHGGWAQPYFDPVMAKVAGAKTTTTGVVIATYEPGEPPAAKTAQV
jgi:hypothetical protein